jgi:hypothetical protein
MPSPKTTTLQKVIIVLFTVTIIGSCASLVWISLEKPGKVTKLCENDNKLMRNTEERVFGNNTMSLEQFGRDCTTTVNPPMSGGLAALIDFTTFIGFLFLSASLYACWDRWTKRPIPKD